MSAAHSSALPLPGAVHGLYPERRAPEPGRIEKLRKRAGRLREKLGLDPLRAYQRFAEQVQGMDAATRELSDDSFAAAVHRVRAELGRHSLTGTQLAQAVALVRESIRRETGRTPFATQVIAARIMLDRRLAEMSTGEGKTYAIALAAASAALAGIPVHVITANDYLVSRDAESLAPVYRRLGLRVGAVTAELDSDARRNAYACDITYCTAKELVFDYLRDRQIPEMASNALQRRVQGLAGERRAGTLPILRGLCFAIVDEADNVLLDEAITPLVLSREGRGLLETRHLHQALRIVHRLDQPRHYVLDANTRGVQLTEFGLRVTEETSASWGGLWRNPRFRDGLVTLALAALHCYHRDLDYLVTGGPVSDGASPERSAQGAASSGTRIQMIDATTGRIAEGRQWSRGLHQLLEIKEDCAISPSLQTLAQITYQRFFPRYLQLGGASATLHEAASELWYVYGLAVTRVPLQRPSLRRDLPPRLFYSARDKWAAVVEHARGLQSAGRAVLIGTDSVADSENLSGLLSRAKIRHVVLNARQDQAEAEVVASAGQRGAITVATNMAGRGTDIPLTAEVKANGGLHVISCQHNSSARIDRQLHGRCARQGDPGSTQTLLSLQDALLARYLSPSLRRWLASVWPDAAKLPDALVRLLMAWPQHREQARQRKQRARLLQRDRQLRRWLSIGGAGE